LILVQWSKGVIPGWYGEAKRVGCELIEFCEPHEYAFTLFGVVKRANHPYKILITNSAVKMKGGFKSWIRNLN